MGQVLLVAYRIRGSLQPPRSWQPALKRGAGKGVKGWSEWQALQGAGLFRTGWGSRSSLEVELFWIKGRSSGCTAEQTAS